MKAVIDSCYALAIAGLPLWLFAAWLWSPAVLLVPLGLLWMGITLILIDTMSWK